MRAMRRIYPERKNKNLAWILEDELTNELERNLLGRTPKEKVDKIVAMKKAGKFWPEIGSAFGISYERARQIVLRTRIAEALAGARKELC